MTKHYLSILSTLLLSATLLSAAEEETVFYETVEGAQNHPYYWNFYEQRLIEFEEQEVPFILQRAKNIETKHLGFINMSPEAVEKRQRATHLMLEKYREHWKQDALKWALEDLNDFLENIEKEKKK